MKYADFDELGEMLARGMNVKTNIVPVVDESDEDVLLNDDNIEGEMPVLPVMDQVLFPGVLIPIAARRLKSRQMLEDVDGTSQHIVVFSQLTNNDNPSELDLHPVGVVAKVLRVFNIRHDVTVAMVQGVMRCHSLEITSREPYMRGRVTMAPESANDMDSQAFKRRVKLLRKQYGEMMKNRMQDDELAHMLTGIGSDKIFINFAATHLDIDVEQKYSLLACDNYFERVDRMLEHLNTLKGLDELRREIDSKTKDELERQQREYYLRQQMNVIQEELGNNGFNSPWADNDIEDLRARAAKKEWPEAVAKIFERELSKLSRIQPMSSDYTVELSYLDTLLEVPWMAPKESAADYDIRHAREVMDKDHYGIEKVKERIVEYLAVKKRQVERGVNPKAQVLCLVGPPGTGKTSVCRSIAEALGRPYRRVALGGLHDEAEIRGHRRTYVGAMPGRIMQEIIKGGKANPVFVLDEIDKVQPSAHGDPSAALLEVLDPEQNCHFHDNYINIDYDLSKAFFIATANNAAAIHPALLDRMEVIDFSGYLLEEKLEIAKRHLLPKIMKDAVVDGRTMRFSPEMVAMVVNDYTREGGVRQLEKQLAKVVRHRVVEMESGVRYKSAVTEQEVKKVLGLPIHNSEHRLPAPREGVVTGLAWTPVGGEILFIEASLSKGKGTLTMTGNLGDVMKESATLAFEYIKANSDRFGIDSSTLEKSNIHIHVPEGATPKDGPSAGITMFVAMVSALSHRKVRPEVAMTGEITLRGTVTPIGGVKEKILAAKRAGITDLLLCHDNRRDIEEIEPRYLEGLTFHYIGEMSEALPLALVEEKKPAAPKAPKASRSRKVSKALKAIVIVALSVFNIAQAQESAFVAYRQNMAILPGNVKNVSFVDGELYCYASGVMLKAQRSGEQLLGFWADTNFVRLHENVDYVVRHPQTGDIYFTARDEKGRSYLYRCTDFGLKGEKVKLVKLGGGWFNKGMTVEHPTFTVDGKMVIFSSNDTKHSEGGYDLWFSLYDGKHWTKPENLGRRINTGHDEVTPVIYRDCLLFSSDGHTEDNNRLSLYSTRLISDKVEGDTVGMLQIGRCRVQRLPSPLNADYADDMDMAIDTVADCGYWVSNRVTTDTDSQLYSFSGALDGVLLWGTVTDKQNHVLPGVAVVAKQGKNVVCNTATDQDGHYRMYLQCNQYYEISYQKDQFFVDFEQVNTTKGEEEYLISEQRVDVALDRLPIGQRIFFEDLYGPDVDVELSDRGMELLAPLVQFLNDNPSMSVTMSLVNDLTNDRNFNMLLTDERVQSLENYLLPLLPPTVKIDIDNGCIGRDGCSNGSGVSRLTVLIDK